MINQISKKEFAGVSGISSKSEFIDNFFDTLNKIGIETVALIIGLSLMGSAISIWSFNHLNVTSIELTLKNIVVVSTHIVIVSTLLYAIGKVILAHLNEVNQVE